MSLSNIADTIVGVTNSLVDDLVVLSFKSAVGVENRKASLPEGTLAMV
ncbi:MAG: hypothetical protein IKW53_00170 [Clostridia bacterium]|nr:hypothetical protein [Clostridia bacterium]